MPLEGKGQGLPKGAFGGNCTLLPFLCKGEASGQFRSKPRLIGNVRLCVGSCLESYSRTTFLLERKAFRVSTLTFMSSLAFLIFVTDTSGRGVQETFAFSMSFSVFSS
jgi:hypothetical protein